MDHQGTSKPTVLITMMNLYGGGAERSLVNLLSEIDYSRVSVSLLLFQKSGMFLDEVPDEVNLVDPPFVLECLYRKFSWSLLTQLRTLPLLLLRVLATSFIRIIYFKEPRRMQRQRRWRIYRKFIGQDSRLYDYAIAYLECEPTYYVADFVNSKHKICWIHNNYSETGLSAELDSNYYRKYQKVVTISQECVRDFKGEFPQESDKVTLMENIVPADKILRSSQQSSEFAFSSDAFKLLSIGRLDRQKGFDFAIEAANILQKNSVQVDWQIIGSGAEKESLQNLIKKYKLRNIRLVGTTSNPYPMIAAADLLVQTSRYEGKSVVLDEAKILTTPILATRYPTVRDQVTDDIGVVVGFNPDEIASKIAELAKNRKRLDEYRANLRKETIRSSISSMARFCEVLRGRRKVV